jgi:hypothetical protein
LVGRVVSENERGPENVNVLVRVTSEHVAGCRSVPAVSETIANAASE